MSQITLYLDEQTAQRMQRAAAGEGLSQSQWVARLIRARLDTTWPQHLQDLAGAWQDFPTLEEIREREATDTPREALQPVVCLDTNTLIHFFKGMGGVGERLLATPPAQVAVPTVVVYEIQVGILKSGSPERRRTDFDAFLAPLQVLPFGQAEAAEAAAIRAHLENAGAPIGPMDTLIAATARANGATLISRNLREFSRVPDLRLESWYREQSTDREFDRARGSESHEPGAPRSGGTLDSTTPEDASPDSRAHLPSADPVVA